MLGCGGGGGDSELARIILWPTAWARTFFLEFIPLKDLVFGENLLHVHFAPKLT